MNEAEEAQHARQEREAAEKQRAIEQKKPKLNLFDPNSSVPNWIEPRPSPYALSQNRAAPVDDTFVLRSLAAQASSKNIRNDEDLS